MIDNFIIAGFSGIIIIVILVQAGKAIFKWQDAQSAIASLVIGLILALLNYASHVYPSFDPWWDQAIVGIMAGAAASGAYTINKTIRERLERSDK